MMGFVFVCFIVPAVVAVTVDMVRERISKKNVPDKVVVSEGGDDLEAMDEARLQQVLQSLEDGREKVIKALAKTKNQS